MVPSTIYSSVATSKVLKDCSVHSQGCLSRNWSAIIAELEISRYSISQTVRTKALVEKGGFP